MLDQLTVVVTCTARKSLEPRPDLTVRTLPSLPAQGRVEQWVERLDTAVPIVTLRRLYKGDSWVQVLLLEAAAKTVARSVRVLVASAGLGLRDIDSEAAPYSATFSPRDSDTVCVGADEQAAWWRGLASAAGALSPREVLSGPTLLVMSNSYAQALGPSLEHLADRRDILTFGGNSASRGVRVRADKSLRSQLGGTAVSLNLRSAIKWLELSGANDIFSAESHERWRKWAQTSSRIESYQRVQQTDDQVRTWIDRTLEAEPKTSASVALRSFRQAGFACEQRRFAGLFKSLRGSHD